MEKELIIFLTDSYSLKTIASGVQEASIEYQLIKGTENIKKFIEEVRDNLTCKIKRPGYAYGLSKLTGYEFPSVESGGNTLVDAPYDSMVINVGLANPTREDIDSEENWDRGLLELELRVITIRRKK